MSVLTGQLGMKTRVGSLKIVIVENVECPQHVGQQGYSLPAATRHQEIPVRPAGFPDVEGALPQEAFRHWLLKWHTIRLVAGPATCIGHSCKTAHHPFYPNLNVNVP